MASKRLFVGWFAVVLIAAVALAAPWPAAAQDTEEAATEDAAGEEADDEEAKEVEISDEVVVIGSRAGGRTATESMGEPLVRELLPGVGP